MSRIHERKYAEQFTENAQSINETRARVWPDDESRGFPKGKIQGKELIELFEQRGPFSYDLCESWEDFILSRLSQVFQFNSNEMIIRYFQDGAPQIYLCYLERQLIENNGTQFAHIFRTLLLFLKERKLQHIKLLSVPQA